MTPRKPAEQLNLDLPSRPAMGREDFLEAPSNALALASIDAPQGLPAGTLLLTGPTGAGKTHLLTLWAARSDAIWVTPDTLLQQLPALLAQDTPRSVALDDADRISGAETEEALFHLMNHLRGRGELLLTAKTAVRDWPITLPDLISRLKAVTHVALSAPDDALLAAVMVKQFGDRQLRVQPDLIDYLLGRIERSFGAVADIVARLDARGMKLKRPVNRALAQELLAEDLDKSGSEGA